MNSTLQPLGEPQRSRPPPSREETETGIDLVALHREPDEAVQTLVQLKRNTKGGNPSNRKAGHNQQYRAVNIRGS